MKKYVCTACGYVYDPAVGDPDSDSNPALLLRISRRIGYAPSVV